MIRDALEKLVSSSELSRDEIAELFGHMLAGKLADVQTAAILAAWRLRGERAVELTEGARILRKHAAKVELPAQVRPLIDNCGTGGDGAGSFNISTAAAIVAASAGARVAKHGNRSFSSPCGSADLLFEAGFPDSLTPPGAALLLQTTGFTFFFAPSYHPVMKHVAGVRQALGVRTIFNLLGPLANPIAPEFQVIGVGKPHHLRPMGEALAALGVERALIVHSRDGLDELSPAAPTDAVLVERSSVKALVIDPATYGIKASFAGLKGGSPATNLALLQQMLDGEITDLAVAVTLNAAAVLWISGKAQDLREGLELARTHLSQGKSRNFFYDWVEHAKALAQRTPR